MRTIRITILGLCCLLLITLCAPILYAQTTHVFSFRNNKSTEKLKIRLEQYQIDRSGNVTVAQSKSVLPGEHVSYIPVIRNEGADCYVRLQISIEMEDRDVKRGILLEDLYGLGPNWKRLGEYYYYTKILKHGDSIAALAGIEIPHFWTQRRHESSGFTLYAIADAIQSLYTPNFNSDTPWDEAAERFRTSARKSMPGGMDCVQTGDDSLYRCWIAIFILAMSVIVYSLWNRRR